MNKTLTINISGIIFNIEEDAFEALKKYLAQIKSHFVNDPGCDEIMSDIEARIAEMLQDKAAKSNQVIVIEDIDRVIETLGKPEDFNDDKSESKTAENYSHQTFTGTYNKKRRVYRNSDDKVFGGVCSGIGMYFDFDPLWLRLAFGVSFLAFGSGLLFYILLWIVIPEAKTAAEKLEMKGEKVDINNIGKQVSEEFERVKSKFENNSKEFSKNYGPKAQNGIRGFVDLLVDIATKIVYAFAKFIGIFFIIFGLILLIAFLSSLFGSSNIIHIQNGTESFSYSFKDLILLLLNNENQISLAAISIFCILCIPLIMLIYKGLRIVFKINVRNRIFSTIASLLFLIGISIAIYLIMDITVDFKSHAKSVDKLKFLPVGSVLKIESDERDMDFVDSDEEEEDEDFKSFKIGKWNYKIKDNVISMSNIEFDIEKSETDSFELLISRIAKGSNGKSAYLRAEEINYKFIQSDSTLILPSIFETDLKNKWRGQKIKLKLLVPVGKTIFLSKNTNSIIYDIKNIGNTLDSEMVNRRWIMKPEGLTCVDCEGINEKSKNKNYNSDEDNEEF